MRNKDLPFPFLGLKCMSTAWENFHHEFILLKGRDVDTERVNKIRFIYIKSQRTISMVRRHDSMIKNILYMRGQFSGPKRAWPWDASWWIIVWDIKIIWAIWMLHCYHHAQRGLHYAGQGLLVPRTTSIFWLWDTHKDHRVPWVQYTQIWSQPVFISLSLHWLTVDPRTFLNFIQELPQKWY